MTSDIDDLVARGDRQLRQFGTIGEGLGRELLTALEAIGRERDEAISPFGDTAANLSADLARTLTDLDRAEAALSTANAEVERLKAALKQVVGDYDACSGAEPSLSVLHRSIDLVARAALEKSP